MPTQIQFNMEDVFLVGGKNVAIELVIDGETKGVVKFGESITVDVTQGNRLVHVVSHTTIKRKSKAILVSVSENQTSYIEGKYSRMWGNIKIKAT